MTTGTEAAREGSARVHPPRKRALFVGIPHKLALAYPPGLRAELARSAEVLGETTSGDIGEIEGLGRVEVLLATWGMPVLDAPLLDRMPELRAVFYAAGSVKSFVTPEAYRRGILISSAAGANAIPVAEFSAAAILLCLKRVFPHTRALRRLRAFERLPLPGAYGTRVGLVSLGIIGRLTAEKLRSLEIEVVAFDPFATPEMAAGIGVRLVGLEELFATCDVVSLHTPNLPETRGMIGADLLGSMKEGAALINTARGAVIDQPALCAVLERRPDLTALLDVTDPEPPEPGSPLYALPNVFLTPHIAGSIGGEVGRMGRWMAEEFFRFAGGEPLRHGVTEAMLARMA